MAAKIGDDLRKAATTIVILLAFSCAAHADIDFTVGTSLRSYPLSGIVEVDSGYDFLLWGDYAPGAVWYGYFRPSLTGDTAMTYNSLAASLDVYPLAFLGGRVGGEAIENDTNYSAYDCNTYICRGRYYHTYAQAQLSLGAGPVFMQARWKRERWTEHDATSPTAFIEPTSGFALDSGGDAETIYRGMLGYKLDDTYSLAAAMIYAHADSGGVSRFPLALLRYSSADLTAGIGGGAFRSPLKPWGASALLYFQWNALPSLDLK